MEHQQDCQQALPLHLVQILLPFLEHQLLQERLMAQLRRLQARHQFTATAAEMEHPSTGNKPVAPQELSIAERVHVGHLPCELGASVRLTADANLPGYFNLQGKGYKYRMRPVTTSTGAIRLEDEKAGAVWLQLANKSMLMDQKKGRRLADECAHPDQVAVAKEMKINPPPALIDVSNGASSNQR